MISSVVVHITLYTVRLKSSVLERDAFVQPRPSLILILVVELVRLYTNKAGTQDSILRREFFGRREVGSARLSREQERGRHR